MSQAIFSDRNQAISWEEAYDILQSQHKYSCCNLPPVKPKAGKVFLFSAKEISKRSKQQLAIDYCSLATPKFKNF